MGVDMQLKKIVKITGTIQVETGLHIGAGNDSIQIGGVDSTVVKDPITKKPYIPGSSLKGKIRTLLEWATCRVNKDGKPWSTKEENDPIVRIFGNGENVKDYDGGPTRASFSDCFIIDGIIDNEKLKQIGYTEIKTEVTINRISGKAASAGPRSTERVPRGAQFKFEIAYKIFDDDDEKNLDLLLYGMKLLEMDGLGGSVSRGYGRISFQNVQVDGDSNRFNSLKIDEKSFEQWILKQEN